MNQWRGKMKLNELMDMDAGTKGINVEGAIAGVWKPKTSPWGMTQFLLITGDGETIGVQARDTDFGDRDKGATVKITGATWRSYESKGETRYVLEIPKSKGASISVVGSSPPSPAKVVKSLDDLREEILKEYSNSLIKAMELLGDTVMSEMLTVCKEKGWESKDVTAVAASLFIELNKKK